MKNKKIKLLCTLGPSSMNREVVSRLDDLGVDIFRINLSHTRIEDLEEQIRILQGFTSKSICLDTEGAQVRTSYIDGDKTIFDEGSIVEISNKTILGNSSIISLNPEFVAESLKSGDLISVDFDSVILLIVSTNPVRAKVVSGGLVGSNKAISVDRHLDLPVVSKKDEEAIKIGLRYGINHFALSFANTGKCVSYFRSLIGTDTFLISKVESRLGLQNLHDIIEQSDAILIDRGDLSREEPIEKIPFLQKMIIRSGNAAGVPVYVATNLLESMVKDKKPTRAEAGDVINTLLDGADGLVLAAETAIGKYPVNCAVMITKLIQQFHHYRAGATLEELQKKESFLLVEPHGGQLVNEVLENYDSAAIADAQHLDVDETVLMDVEQIAIGTFSPLRGFMNKEELESVLNEYRLPNGTIWPMPVTLQVGENEASRFFAGMTVALTLKNDEQPYALLKLESVYRYDLDKLSTLFYGTNDKVHPGVRVLHSRGEWFLSGRVSLLRRLPSELKHYEMTPRQCRTIFENRGWSRVMGFHTRNVIHMAHEYVQMTSLEKYFCDGLLSHPVIGPKKVGDYTPSIIMKSYEIMLKEFFPKGKVLLAGFQNYSRYAGPREAVFTALCRKNFGCSHFIIGRDHTGVGNFYAPTDSHKLFDRLGDIGIVPVYFEEVYYCRTCGKHVEECSHGRTDILSISGTEGRDILRRREVPSDSFMREEISRLILNELEQGNEVFVA